MFPPLARAARFNNLPGRKCLALTCACLRGAKQARYQAV